MMVYNMLDLIVLLNNEIKSGADLCNELEPVLRIVGIVVLGIKIVVPIVLIIIGMLDLAKAVGQKDENEIKKSQNLLIKRAIVAVIVFLVITFVQIIMSIIGDASYKDCMTCINKPFSCRISNDDYTGKSVDQSDSSEEEQTRMMLEDTIEVGPSHGSM